MRNSHDFIPEAASPGDPQVSEVSLGDLHFSSEAIVGRANLTVQSGLSTGIHSNHWLQTRFEPERSVTLAFGACCASPKRRPRYPELAVQSPVRETAEKAAIYIAVRSFFMGWSTGLLFMAGRSRCGDADDRLKVNPL